MPPKKKRKSKAAPAKASPSAFMAKSQEALIKKLKKAAKLLDDEDDIDRLVASVRALIDTNSEIWERCLPSKTQKEETVKELKFYRSGYSAVEVATRNSQVEFEASASLETNTFLDFPIVPEILTEVFPFDDTKVFPDYIQYLERSSWLQESISIPFLTILKEHQKDVQVALGEIESWLVAPAHALQFIKQQFKKNIDLDEFLGGVPEAQDTCMSAVCVRCFEPKNLHRARISGYGGALCCKSLETAMYFEAPKVELKSSPNFNGEVNITFPISTEGEQAKLQKFIEFVDA